MVKTVLGVLGLLCAASALAAPAYQLDKREVALGESVSLTLTARPGMLDKIDLTPLARDFELRDRSLNHDQHSDSLSVTLYPRTVGNLSLRVPGLPGLPGRAPTLRVEAESANIPKVRFRVELAPEQPSARQPFKLVVEACDDGSLLWKRPALTTTEGLYIRALGDRQLQVERDGERCTAHRWQWAVTPTAAGAFALSLPTLEAGKFGEQLRYPPPPVAFDIRPIPMWLPMEVAVGRVTATAEAMPARWPQDRPLARHIAIQGAYSPAALRKILALQLAGHSALARYAPEVVPVSADDDPVPRFDVTLYARPGDTGRFAFPALTLPWFDTDSGRLRAVALPPATVEILDPSRTMWLRIGISALIALALAFPSAYLYRALLWRRIRRRCLATVAAAHTPEQVAAAIRSCRFMPNDAPANTLRGWLRQVAPSDPALNEVVSRLEQACYGGNLGTVDEVREELLARLGRLRPQQGIRSQGRQEKS